MGTDDDQERLLRALRAPGSHAELSEEERYRTMFRAAHSTTAPVTTRHSRAPHRLLVGGATAVVLAVGTGGVAAAYSGNLPSPIQTLAHHVIGAPEATPPSSSGSQVPGVRRSPSPSGPPAGASRSSSARPTHQRSHHPARPVPPPSAPASPRPSTSAPASSSPTSPASPTSTGTPAPVLTGVRVVGSSHRADIGARVRFSGQLTYAGTPMSRQRVVLQVQVGSRWTPVGHGRTDAGGSITLTAQSLQGTSSFRLLAGQGSGSVHSATWRVAMHPLVTADVSASKRKATIDVTAVGGYSGDHVTLVTGRDGHPVIVGRARLDSSGSAQFIVTPDQQRMSYNVVLDPTKRHTSARVAVHVKLAREAGRR